MDDPEVAAAVVQAASVAVIADESIAQFEVKQPAVKQSHPAIRNGELRVAMRPYGQPS